jgi:hypothetical protein
VNTVINPRVPQMVGAFLTSWDTISWSRRTLLHVVSFFITFFLITCIDINNIMDTKGTVTTSQGHKFYLHRFYILLTLTECNVLVVWLEMLPNREVPVTSNGMRYTVLSEFIYHKNVETVCSSRPRPAPFTCPPTHHSQLPNFQFYICLTYPNEKGKGKVVPVLWLSTTPWRCILLKV